MRNKIRPYGYFQSLLQTPQVLAKVIQGYFDSLAIGKAVADGIEAPNTTEDKAPSGCWMPSLPGLCYCLGTTPKYVKDYVKSDDADPEAVHYINQAVTHIEGYLVEEGLSNRLNASLAKFILGAHCDTADINRAGSVSIGSLSNNTILLEWATPEDVKPGLAKQFLEEAKHLKQIDIAKSFKEDEERSKGLVEADGDFIDVVYKEVDDDDDLGDLMR